ncbi:MAG: L,D-transpeptidase [Puniceicoccales bacterium]|jgi:hypothetical protein|nr:L,D-transpeptidase [Puniceicoccales bacterium]
MSAETRASDGGAGGGTGARLLAALEQRRRELGHAPREDALCVSLAEQRLWHYRRGALVAEYPVSTSRAAPSCVPDSLGTPLGLHEIAERIGAGAPAGMVFVGRVAQGFLWRDAPPELAPAKKNLVTTRILWLAGLEDGVNRGTGCDTHSRYIYIHGTNQPEKIGTPNSHGCVLLRDADVIALFDALDDRPTHVLIA